MDANTKKTDNLVFSRSKKSGSSFKTSLVISPTTQKLKTPSKNRFFTMTPKKLTGSKFKAMTKNRTEKLISGLSGTKGRFLIDFDNILKDENLPTINQGDSADLKKKVDTNLKINKAMKKALKRKLKKEKKSIERFKRERSLIPAELITKHTRKYIDFKQKDRSRVISLNMAFKLGDDIERLSTKDEPYTELIKELKSSFKKSSRNDKHKQVMKGLTDIKVKKFKIDRYISHEFRRKIGKE